MPQGGASDEEKKQGQVFFKPGPYYENKNYDNRILGVDTSAVYRLFNCIFSMCCSCPIISFNR